MNGWDIGSEGHDLLRSTRFNESYWSSMEKTI